ncbi:MAG: hypothetical protein LBL71_03905, partial [Endomicrobium sp.]|nr:hypothetical protein [Endomicrobium sp.]
MKDEKDELVYSFDLGSGSIGICVRKGREILSLQSLLIDSDFASVTDAAKRRRQIRTRLAHKEREKWWDEQAETAGIEILSTAQPTKENPDLKPDERMLIEFPKDKNDKTIYSSQLLRIALLQGVKLEGWQVYKAIRSAMQRRGYDACLPWKKGAGKESVSEEDEKENRTAVQEYNEKIKELFGSRKEFYYPCYYEAYTQRIWDPKKPDDLSKRLSFENSNPARNKEGKSIPPRDLVQKELEDHLKKAAELFPKITGKENFIIYGPSEESYASYKDKKYSKYRGTAWDWQGL